MLRAVMLIKEAKEGKGCYYASKLYKSALEMKGVVDAFPVLGRFDDVVFIEAEDYPSMKEVARKVASHEGVKTTETLPQGD